MSNEIPRQYIDHDPIDPVGLTFTTGRLIPFANKLKTRAKEGLSRAVDELPAVRLAALRLGVLGVATIATFIMDEIPVRHRDTEQPEPIVTPEQPVLPHGE